MAQNLIERLPKKYQGPARLKLMQSWRLAKSLQGMTKEEDLYKRMIEEIFNIEGITPKVIVEAGAHIGVDTVDFAHRWPSARVYSVEPIQSLFDQLLQNTRRFAGRISVERLAFSETTGVGNMHVSHGGQGGSSSLFAPKEHLRTVPSVHFSGREMVPTINLGEWADQKQLPHIDLLWLDTQGSEYSVLRGAPELLKRTGLIFVEVNFIETYESVGLWPELKNYLESLGFQLLSEPENEGSGQGNALFINNRFPAH